MDKTGINSLITTNLDPVAPDTIDDVELRAVLDAMLNEEMIGDGATTSNLTFQSARGTFYSTTISSATVTINPAGDVIGHELIFKHASTAVVLQAATGTITYLNAQAYVPLTTNYIKVKVVDTGVMIAWVMAPKLVEGLKNGTANVSLASERFSAAANGIAFLAALNPGSGAIDITMGDLNSVAQGTKIRVVDSNEVIDFQQDSTVVFRFDVGTKQFTLYGLSTAEPDTAPSKFAGVDPDGTLVKFNPAEHLPFLSTVADGSTAVQLDSKGPRLYGFPNAHTTNITVSDLEVGGTAIVRVENATAGGPAISGTGITVTKVGDWATDYSTSKVNHIRIVAWSATDAFAYIDGFEP